MSSMPYSFPSASDPVLQKALDITLDYLEFTGQAFPFAQTERLCALTILNEWHAGNRHVIWLVNKAIVTVEEATKPCARSVQLRLSGRRAGRIRAAL
jgi:hypothetical protein